VSAAGGGPTLLDAPSFLWVALTAGGSAAPAWPDALPTRRPLQPRVRAAQLRLQGRRACARTGRRDEVASHAIGEAGSRRGFAAGGGARATWSTRQAPSGSP